MRAQPCSPHSTRDSVIVGQDISFSCGLSATTWRTGELHSACGIGGVESWAAEHDRQPPRRLAGLRHSAPRLAESISATRATSPAASGGISHRAAIR